MATYKGVAFFPRKSHGLNQDLTVMKMIEWPVCGRVEISDPQEMSTIDLKNALKVLGQEGLLADLETKDDIREALIEILWTGEPIKVGPEDSLNVILTDLRTTEKIKNVDEMVRDIAATMRAIRTQQNKKPKVAEKKQSVATARRLAAKK